MAARLDAIADSFTRTTNLPSSTAFTICGWARIVTDRNSETALASLESSGGTSYAEIYTGSDGISLLLETSGGTTAFASSPGAGVDFFFAMTCSGTGVGSLIGYWALQDSTTFVTASRAGVSFTSATLFLGNDGVSNFLNGRLSNVKVWDAVLTSAELWNEMQVRRLGITASINGWYPMLHSERTADYSGNGRSLTENGTLADEDAPPVSWGGSPIIYPFTAPAAGGISIPVVQYHRRHNF